MTANTREAGYLQSFLNRAGKVSLLAKHSCGGGAGYLLI